MDTGETGARLTGHARRTLAAPEGRPLTFPAEEQSWVRPVSGATLLAPGVLFSAAGVRQAVAGAARGEAGDLQIAFNAKYLQDVLGVVETEGVVLELTEPLRPGILRPIGDNADDYLCVLMPMQVI